MEGDFLNNKKSREFKFSVNICGYVMDENEIFDFLSKDCATNAVYKAVRKFYEKYVKDIKRYALRNDD